MTSDEFKSSREVLAARRKELKGKGLGNRPNKGDTITEKMEDLLWEKKELGGSTPRSVQNTVFFYLNSCFSFRGNHKARQMTWGDVSLKCNEQGREYLEFSERLTKTRTGNGTAGSRAFQPKIFSTNED